MECSKLEELIEKIKRQTTLEENDIKSQLINNNYKRWDMKSGIYPYLDDN